MASDAIEVVPAPVPRSLLWTGHVSVWMLSALAARLSRVGSQLEVHITGRHGAELAPDHLRQILTAPTTEFKAISFVGVTAGFLLAMALRKHSPKALRRFTLLVTVLSIGVFLAGYAS